MWVKRRWEFASRRSRENCRHSESSLPRCFYNYWGQHFLWHKMSYSALSDLLGLITLHLSPESKTQHLQSLYFLKKAFASQSKRNAHEDSDLVTAHEYCMTRWKSHEEAMCRICGTQQTRKTNNYFLALDIGVQLKSLFKGKFKLIWIQCQVQELNSWMLLKMFNLHAYSREGHGGSCYEESHLSSGVSSFQRKLSRLDIWAAVLSLQQ